MTKYELQQFATVLASHWCICMCAVTLIAPQAKNINRRVLPRPCNPSQCGLAHPIVSTPQGRQHRPCQLGTFLTSLSPVGGRPCRQKCSSPTSSPFSPYFYHFSPFSTEAPTVDTIMHAADWHKRKGDASLKDVYPAKRQNISLRLDFLCEGELRAPAAFTMHQIVQGHASTLCNPTSLARACGEKASTSVCFEGTMRSFCQKQLIFGIYDR